MIDMVRATKSNWNDFAKPNISTLPNGRFLSPLGPKRRLILFGRRDLGCLMGNHETLSGEPQTSIP